MIINRTMCKSQRFIHGMVFARRESQLPANGCHAAGCQRTGDALALDLPESRALAAISMGLTENVGIALEWARSDDYGTVLLAAEF